jgi:hypothetical protein
LQIFEYLASYAVINSLEIKNRLKTRNVEMPSIINIENLPYNIEHNMRDQINFLSDLLGLSKDLFRNAGQKEIDAMCATILYRHLTQAHRNEALVLIRSVPNMRLQRKLIDSVLFTTFVNPQWGIWSLTNKELAADKDVHDFIDSYASYIGINASVIGIKDLFDQAKKSISSEKTVWGAVAMLIVWGVVAFNKIELNKVNKELSNRAIQLTTEFH